MNTKDRINKVIAILIILILNLGQSLFIGKGLYSYAANAVKTNNLNIEFSAYFIDQNEQKITQIDKRIDEEVLLYMEVSVKNEGYFNGEIEFNYKNFDIVKEENNQNILNISDDKITLEQINGSSTEKIKLKLIPKTKDLIDIYDLNSNTELVLKGKYVNAKSKEQNKDIEIEERQNIVINWKVSEDTKAELDVKLLTNSIYNIENEEKKVVQILVNSNILDNNFPVKYTKIIANVPKEVKEVRAHSRSTDATNKNAVFDESCYIFKENENLLEINISNVNEKNISWEKDVKDEIIITYIFDKEIELNNLEIGVKSSIMTYDENLFEAEKSVKIDKQKNGVISFSKQLKEKNIYKGKLYTGEEREYTTTTKINMDLENLGYSISLQEKPATFIKEQQEIPANIEYKNTIIKKEDFVKIFGHEGYLIIKNSNGQEITTINENSKANESGNIQIDYEAGTKEIQIETSKQINIGTLNIVNIQVILNSNLSKEEIDTLTGIKNKIQVGDSEISKTIKLRNPVNEVELITDTDLLSTTADEQELTLEINLKAKNETNSLFKNPNLKITFPAELQILNIEHSILYRNGLKLKDRNIIKNENNEYEINLKYNGEQNKYDIAGGTKIYLKMKLKTNKSTPTKTSQISLLCYNEKNNETTEAIANTSLESRKGIMIYNQIKNINKNNDSVITVDSIEKAGDLDINAESKNITINTSLINNYDETLNNVTLIGRIPVATKETEYSAKLNEIKLTNSDASILYSKNAEANKDSEDWSTDISEATMYKIVFNKIEPKETIIIDCSATIPENIKPNQKGYFVTMVECEYKGSIKSNTSKILLSGEKNLNTDKIESIKDEKLFLKDEIAQGVNIEILATSANRPLVNEDSVFEGQTIKYNIKVTNNSGKDISNIQIKTEQKNGYIWKYKEEEVTNYIYEGGVGKEHYYQITDSNETDLEKIDILKNEETYTYEYESSTYKLNENGIDGDLTYGIITVLSNESGINKTIKTIENKIKKAEIKLDLYEGDSKECIWYGEYAIPALLLVENIGNSVQNNIDFQVVFSKNLSLGDEQTSLNRIINCLEAPNKIILEDKTVNENGDTIVTFKVTSINVNEIIVIPMGPETKKIEKEKEKVEMLVQAETEANNLYVSNNMSRDIYNVSRKISLEEKMKDESGKIIKEDKDLIKNNDKIEITATIKNIEDKTLYPSITYKLDKAFDIESVNLEVNNQKEALEFDEVNQIHIINKEIKANDTLNIIVYAKVNTEKTTEDRIINILEVVDTATRLPTKIESNYAVDQKQDSADIEESEIMIIDGENEETLNADEENLEVMNRITGTVWIDKNKNGKKDENEETVPNIEVNALNNYTGEVIATVVTNNDGNYEINLPQASYILAFMYETKNYNITKYQLNGVEQYENSDAITKTMQIKGEEQLVGASDTLILNSNSKQRDIDLGLINKNENNIEIKKQIKKITIIKDNEQKIYENNDLQTIDKIEISKDDLNNAKAEIEYEIVVTNNGEETKKVEKIADYKPQDLIFNQSLNTNWVEDDTVIYNTTLENISIRPKESKNLKLVLTKDLTNENIGLINNRVKIIQKDENGENNAGIIIKVKTANYKIYIMILICTGLILCTVIYIFKKLKRGEKL